jgi:hypothetical protein
LEVGFIKQNQSLKKQAKMLHLLLIQDLEDLDDLNGLLLPPVLALDTIKKKERKEAKKIVLIKEEKEKI